MAASSGNLPLVKLIHQQLKLPLDLRDKGGDTVLSLAVANGHQTVSAWLIDAGAPVTGYNNQGYTLVHQAFASKNPDLVRELLGVEISKEQQSSDWGAPELTEKQLAYAANDVAHLHAMREKLDDMLARENRTHLAQAAFGFLPTRAELDLAGWEESDIFAH